MLIECIHAPLKRVHLHLAVSSFRYLLLGTGRLYPNVRRAIRVQRPRKLPLDAPSYIYAGNFRYFYVNLPSFLLYFYPYWKSTKEYWLESKFADYLYPYHSFLTGWNEPISYKIWGESPDCDAAFYVLDNIDICSEPGVGPVRQPKKQSLVDSVCVSATSLHNRLLFPVLTSISNEFLCANVHIFVHIGGGGALCVFSYAGKVL